MADIPTAVWVVLAVLAAAGVSSILWPAAGFMLGERWMFKDRPEPSPAYLTFARAMGVVLVVLAVLGTAGMLWLGYRADQRAAARAHCEDLLAQFEEVAEFDLMGDLTNPDEVDDLAEDLGLVATVGQGYPTEEIRVSDGDGTAILVVTSGGGRCLP